MAIDWQHVAAIRDRPAVRQLTAHVAWVGWLLAGTYRYARTKIARTWVGRYFAQSLTRRIFFSNLVGLGILLGGVFWLSQHNATLISAKQESLRVQGEIIAAAIAANATVTTNDITFEEGKQPEVTSVRAPFRDDAFAALDGLELSIRPDQVGPVIRRLVQPGHNTRARIYDREGDIVVDTNPARSSTLPPASEDADGGREKLRVKTNWLRFQSWFDRTDLPIYYEIGANNGKYYKEVREALRGHRQQPMLVVAENGNRIVSLAVPIQRRNVTFGALFLSTRPGEIEQISRREWWLFVSVALLALLTTIAASYQLAKSIAEPVRKLSDAADQVSKSFTSRAELPDFSQRQDEVGRMSSAFLRMTATLNRRIEASEKFAADVAHELKNPLTAARSTAESMGYARTQEQRDQLAQQIQSELKRLNRLITDVANASRLDAELARQETVILDLGRSLSGMVGVLGDIHGNGQRTVSFDAQPRPGLEPRYLVRAHEGRIGQVVTNLVDNAASFSPKGGSVVVKLGMGPSGTEFEIRIEDDGPGIPDDKLEAVFSRFYSDRPESDSTIGKNSGLGLSISREIIHAHGGKIWAENRRDTPGGPVVGARFVFSLPAAPVGARPVDES